LKKKKYVYFDTHIDLIQEKKLLTFFSELLSFLGPKMPFSQEMAKNKETRVL
jgi:hypothetical protein